MLYYPTLYQLHLCYCLQGLNSHWQGCPAVSKSMMKTPEPPGSPDTIHVMRNDLVKSDPDSCPPVVIAPDHPQDGTTGQSSNRRGESKILDIPTKIMDKLGTDDLESYMHYKDLVERHQCQLPEIAVPEETTEDSNGQLKIAVRCQVCQKVSPCWNKLQYHLQTHVNLRPYKCTVCDKKFYAASKLHRHKQTHSGNKPHKCPLCDVRVSRQEHLKRHMLVHFEEKPYKCSSCNHGARRVDSIRQHIKSKHPGEEVEWVFIGGDSEMRKEFVAKFLEEHLKKHAAGTADKVGDNKNTVVKLDDSFRSGSPTDDNSKSPTRDSVEAFNQGLLASSMTNIVVLSKKKSKRKRKGSNPQQIKNVPISPKTPDQLYSSPPLKGDNLSQTSSLLGQQPTSGPGMPPKRECLSPGTSSCSQMPNMSRIVPEKGDYHGTYATSQPQGWTQQSSVHSSISTGQGHVMPQPPNESNQSSLHFQMSQSQHLMHHDPTGLRYAHVPLSGQSGLSQNYLPQNSNWNGQYSALPQMTPPNLYGHGLHPTMVMPNSLGQMMVPIQSMPNPHDNMRNMPDFYRKRGGGNCEQLEKITSRQQNEG